MLRAPVRRVGLRHAVRAGLFLLAWSGGVAAQASTDLFLVGLRSSPEGRLGVEGVTRLTDRAGYDNQPHFIAGGRALLYTSIDAAGQADIYRYDIADRRASRVTRTAPESEYSATPMPGTDRFAVIRVEADSTQRLWSFAPDGTDPRLLIEHLAPVGYQAWLDADRVALFVLGSPATLRLADLRSGSIRQLTAGIGRSLNPVPGRTAFSFVQLEPDGSGWIRVYDPGADAITPLVRAFAENEYHAWTPSGILLTARGSVLFQWDPDRDADWVEIAELAGSGVSGISRLAVSPDGRWLVVVAAH